LSENLSYQKYLEENLIAFDLTSNEENKFFAKHFELLLTGKISNRFIYLTSIRKIFQLYWVLVRRMITELQEGNMNKFVKLLLSFCFAVCLAQSARRKQ